MKRSSIAIDDYNLSIIENRSVFKPPPFVYHNDDSTDGQERKQKNEMK